MFLAQISAIFNSLWNPFDGMNNFAMNILILFYIFQLILNHQDAFQAGNPYPDAYYDSICRGGKSTLQYNLYLLLWNAQVSYPDAYYDNICRGGNSALKYGLCEVITCALCFVKCTG